MADITLDCLNEIREISASLGQLQVMILHHLIPPAEMTFETIDRQTYSLLDNCPHPPNVVSDDGPPRKFRRQLNALHGRWQDQDEIPNVTAMFELHTTLYEWLEGMAVERPARLAVR